MLNLLLTVFVILLVAGLFYWAITQLPLPPIVRSVATVVLVLLVGLYLISLVFGVAPVHLPR